MGLLMSKEARLLDACFKGKIEIVKKLVSEGVDMKARWYEFDLQVST